MRKFFLLIITTLLFYTSCSTVSYGSNIYVMGQPRDKVVKAIGVIVDELEKEKLYSKEDMYAALNGTKQKHKTNIHTPKTIQIEFVQGEYNEEKNRHCIYANASHLKGQCLSGYFDGWYHLIVINNKKIHNTSLAHEIFHYLRKHVEGVSANGHKPKETWKRLFGYQVKGKIGSVNQALKEAGL